ncbi:hypothetical protein PUR71_09965 [Streptomyces sp. SP17BM10]|uniref:hypothetical protein n=1 Tax=Streptomyces sp. SP17BM10 TaxID=3002530 RepID=UPI002E7863FF|nr:hypothetical protein [Streptomyces sp. SP17BM10]MEE1783237.1 hypothetical protein [Streptomyces sp. SP17BM10]
MPDLRRGRRPDRRPRSQRGPDRPRRHAGPITRVGAAADERNDELPDLIDEADAG